MMGLRFQSVYDNSTPSVLATYTVLPSQHFVLAHFNYVHQGIDLSFMLAAVIISLLYTKKVVRSLISLTQDFVIASVFQVW